MGGYNTFCEILSFDKRADRPADQPASSNRSAPSEAERLGLVRMLSDQDEPRTPRAHGAGARGLSSQPRPSEIVPRPARGLDRIRPVHRCHPAEDLVPAYDPGCRVVRWWEMLRAMTARRIAVIVKGYPRLSETFMPRRSWPSSSAASTSRSGRYGIRRKGRASDAQGAIKAPVAYLPEYLYEEPLRVLSGAFWCLGHGFQDHAKTFWRDLKRDFTANRGADGAGPRAGA